MDGVNPVYTEIKSVIERGMEEHAIMLLKQKSLYLSKKELLTLDTYMKKRNIRLDKVNEYIYSISQQCNLNVKLTTKVLISAIRSANIHDVNFFLKKITDMR